MFLGLLKRGKDEGKDNFLSDRREVVKNRDEGLKTS
jgi:hypothetical protein